MQVFFHVAFLIQRILGMLSITHFWLWNNEKYLEARSLSIVPSKLKEGIKTSNIICHT